ncbi:MAG TPA: hypothetical protein VG711_10160, partial [Phycisphaerales bacterium]|nr:hypothetical protein [Phycisphaerales bacterium]
MRKIVTMSVAALSFVVLEAVNGGQAACASERDGLEVREVTVFKDGHALVLREGEMPMNEHGEVVIEDLPAPVLGTFWPFSGNNDVKLRTVTAGAKRMMVERTALSMQELIEGNVGASVIIKDVSGVEHVGTIASLPARSSEELKMTSPPGSAERLSEKGQVLLLKTEYETQVIPLGSIRDLAFKGDVHQHVQQEEMRNVLTLKLDPGRRESSGNANVGLMYLQKGLRWIPNYKVVIDGEGHANIELQATLINELIDLNDVSMNLVIGVPSFAFKDTLDPISLQRTMAQLGQYFDQNVRTGQTFSNSIMTQARYTERRNDSYADSSAGADADMGPEVAGT